MTVRIVHASIFLSLLAGCSTLDLNKANLDPTGIIVQGITVPAQSTDYSCGAAVLSAAMSYWGLPINETDILLNSPPASTQQGYSLAELKSIAEDYGFHAFVMSSDLLFLRQQAKKNRPVIVAVPMVDLGLLEPLRRLSPLARRLTESGQEGFNHFFIVQGFSDIDIYLLDSLTGESFIASRKRFEAVWARIGKPALLVGL